MDILSEKRHFKAGKHLMEEKPTTNDVSGVCLFGRLVLLDGFYVSEVLNTTFG